MSSFTTINGKPVEVKTAAASETVSLPKSAAHHADCGDVGETGEHGDLGSNAADAKERVAK
jgi:hypothetical protein